MTGFYLIRPRTPNFISAMTLRKRPYPRRLYLFTFLRTLFPVYLIEHVDMQGLKAAIFADA